jgi:hypothetical protein
MARISNASNPTDTSIEVLVQFDQGDDATQYLVYITCDQTGERSGDLGYRHSSGNIHWSRSHTFRNLEPGTYYSFTAEYRRVNTSNWYYLYNSYYTTGVKPQKPTSEVTAYHHSSSGRTINIQVTGTYGATSVEWNTPFGFYDRSAYSYPYAESFTAPSYGTEYIIGAYGKNNSGYAPREKLIYTMTEPAIPSINSGGTSNNTVTINVTPQGEWTTIEVEMWTIDATSRIAVRPQGWNGGYAFSVQFGGLVANASYLFRARASKTASYGGYSPTTNWGGWLTVKNEVTRPSNWKWTTSQNANGHKLPGAPFNVLASEWNSFTNRINQFREYKSTENNPIYPYPFTSVAKGNTFYFYYFNEANQAIGELRSTGTANVTSGSKVFASSFNSLMNTLNNIT